MRIGDVENAADLTYALREIRKLRSALESRRQPEVEIGVFGNSMFPALGRVTVTVESLVFMLLANEGAIEHALTGLGVVLQPEPEETTDAG